MSYAKAKGKYGLTFEKGIYPEDVLKYYGASKYGSAPPSLGNRSPRESYNPEKETFMREYVRLLVRVLRNNLRSLLLAATLSSTFSRGSYQEEMEHP